MRAQANLMSKVLRFWGLFRVEDIPYLRVHVVVVNDWKDDNLFIPLILPLAESRVWWRREMGIEVDFQLQGEVIEDLQQDHEIAAMGPGSHRISIHRHERLVRATLGSRVRLLLR